MLDALPVRGPPPLLRANRPNFRLSSRLGYRQHLVHAGASSSHKPRFVASGARIPTLSIPLRLLLSTRLFRLQRVQV